MFFQSLPWLVIEIFVSNIAKSFYLFRNIVCKNIVCDVGLMGVAIVSQGKEGVKQNVALVYFSGT